MAEVILEKVCKTYYTRKSSFQAVKNFTLDIHDKEFLVLVGSSGCGKSTTLRMVAGLEEISEGTIRIGQRVVNDVPPKDRDIAMVFQNYALYPHMTVYKNIAFGLKLRGYPRDEIDQRVQEAAKVLGLAEKLTNRPKELSGGERQRVAVGRAIVRRPSVFLFDEPLSNLDAKKRVEMRTELAKLHHRLQTTMIYVTHDQVEAMTLGDRIVVMEKGVVQQVDRPLTVYDNPVNRFVAGFIGMPPMNFIEGSLRSEDGSLWFVEDSQKGGKNRVRLIPEIAERVANRVDKRIILGIRPEHLQDRAFRRDAPTDAVLQTTVSVIETLGDEMLLHLQTGSSEIIAKAEARHGIQMGQEFGAVVELSKVHLFLPNDDPADPDHTKEVNLTLRKNGS